MGSASGVGAWAGAETGAVVEAAAEVEVVATAASREAAADCLEAERRAAQAAVGDSVGSTVTAEAVVSQEARGMSR